MPNINTNTINTLNSQRYYYGTTPNQAVAEQNQTFFAYFDGVGGTGPEIIDHTAYFIKYLIDTEGNIVNPEPDVVPNRPQAIALYNLINNFEIGKHAVVKLIESDPLLTENPNDNALVGLHPITHIGRIATIAVTGTGTTSGDYITTMSFNPTTTVVYPLGIANMAAQFQNAFNIESVFNLDWVDLPYATTLSSYSNFSWTNNTTSFIPNSSSTEAGTRIKAIAKMGVIGPDATGYSNTTGYGGIPIINNGIQLQILQNSTVIAQSDWFYFDNDSGGYVEVSSSYIDYNATDVFKVQYKIANATYPLRLVGTSYSPSSTEGKFVFTQEYAPASSQPEVVASINAAFLESGQYFGTINSDVSSFLILNESLTSMWAQQTLIQILDSASIEMNYSQPQIPFGDIKAGDYIRFQYNENFAHRILDVVQSNGFVGFVITPSLNINGGFNNQFIDINHFVIYRIINDGSYIILDVPKPVEGNSFSGIIQPEFISKELTDKYDKIVQNLTEKEIIN